MGPRPLLRIIPANIPADCVAELMTKLAPSGACAIWNEVYPVTKATKDKPVFSTHVARANFTCIVLQSTMNRVGVLDSMWCATTIRQNGPLLPRSDVWWWCGATDRDIRLAVTNLEPGFQPVGGGLLFRPAGGRGSRFRRSGRRLLAWGHGDPTYIDSIGVPRGVPDEYKLVDQIAAGWESIFVWITPNKNVDRINYIHYNVQKLGNYTESGFIAIREQLAATSLMAFQNRIAVDMLLAEKGGVCAMFGSHCCTYVPNNTATEGTLSKAIDGLRTLNHKMKEHSGVDTSAWTEWWESMFGKYKNLFFSILVSIAASVVVLALCGCCMIPCIRLLLNRLISAAIAPTNSKINDLFPVLVRQDESRVNTGVAEDRASSGDDVYPLADLFSETSPVSNSFPVHMNVR
ncbi:uncharacterized protein LOC144021158 [Festucalex cinctus]